MKQRHNPPVELGIKIQVDVVALKKLLYWAELAQGEVSALGLVEETHNSNTGILETLLVKDFFLVKQTCNASETQMDSEGVAKLLLDLQDKNIDTSGLRCWAHSHGDMSVFWSSTDEQNIAGLANGEYLLSLVVNKHQHSMMRLDVFHLVHLCIDNISWEVHYPISEDIETFCRQEFAEKVSETPMLTKQFKRRRKHQLEADEIEIIDDNPECEFLGSSFNELEEQDDDFTYY